MNEQLVVLPTLRCPIFLPENMHFVNPYDLPSRFVPDVRKAVREFGREVKKQPNVQSTTYGAMFPRTQAGMTFLEIFYHQKLNKLTENSQENASMDLYRTYVFGHEEAHVAQSAGQQRALYNHLRVDGVWIPPAEFPLCPEQEEEQADLLGIHAMVQHHVNTYKGKFPLVLVSKSIQDIIEKRKPFSDIERVLRIYHRGTLRHHKYHGKGLAQGDIGDKARQVANERIEPFLPSAAK